jgi:hypothetical protein
MKTSCYLAKDKTSGDARESTMFCDKARKAINKLHQASKTRDEDGRIKIVADAFDFLPESLNPHEGPQGENLPKGSVMAWCKKAYFPCEALPVLDAFAEKVASLERSKISHCGESKTEKQVFKTFHRRCEWVFAANSTCTCKPHKGKWLKLCPFLFPAPAQKRPGPAAAPQPDAAPQPNSVPEKRPGETLSPPKKKKRKKKSTGWSSYY